MKLSTRALPAALLLSACTQLPSVEPGVCGNVVLEPPEMCDRFTDDDDLRCGAPSTPGACRFIRDPDGIPPWRPHGLTGC